MQVLVTGGTGFVGRHVIRELIRAGHRVSLLVRPGSEKKLPPDLEVNLLWGDVLDPPSLIAAVKHCEAVVHLVGLIREFPKKGITFDQLHRQATFNMIAAVKYVGPDRFLHMSVLGARQDSASAYYQTKALAEIAVKVSGLDWTIFRPSVIFGPEDVSINLFASQVKKYPVMPVIGSGQYRLQPVSVKTVAQAFARALDNPAAVGQCFDLTGPQAYTFDQLLEAIGRVLGRRVRLVHLPVWLFRLAAKMFGSWPSFPLSQSQLEMLLEGSVADGSPAYQTLNLSPIPLEEGLRSYLKG